MERGEEMRISINGTNGLLSAVWSYYLIMIMGLSVAIPSIQMISLLLLVGSTILYVAQQGFRIRKTRVTPFVVWYIVFIGYVLMSRKWAIIPWDSDIPGTCTRIIICILCLMVYMDSYEKALQMAQKFVIAAVIMDILFMLTSNPATWGSSHVICGITGQHRNNLGCISSFSTILAFWLLQQNRVKYKKLKLAIPILVAGVVFSGSRTNLVVLALGAIFFTLFQENLKKKFRMILLGIVILIAGLIILGSIDLSSEFVQKYLYRIFAIFDENYADSSMDYRAMLKLTALQLIMRSPVIGNGLDATAAYNASLGLASISAHSNYYELLACYGIVGLSIYYSMYLILLKKGFKEMHKNPARKLSCVVFLILLITEYQTFHEFDYFGVFLYMIVYALAVLSDDRKIETKEKKNEQ